MSLHNLTDEYMQSIYTWRPEGAHNSVTQIRSLLGTTMKRLYSLHIGAKELDEYLDIIRKERNSTLTLDVWREQYNQYLLLIAQRQNYINRYNNTKYWFQFKLDDVITLSESNWNMWGSITQLKFGRVVVDCLSKKLDPVFGALLSPTGGIVGPGNMDLYEPADGNDPVVMHGIFHDAGGYLLNYHCIGPGYNYINTRLTLFPRSSPLSTQFAGIRCWMRLIRQYNSSDNDVNNVTTIDGNSDDNRDVESVNILDEMDAVYDVDVVDDPDMDAAINSDSVECVDSVDSVNNEKN